MFLKESGVLEDKRSGWSEDDHFRGGMLGESLSGDQQSDDGLAEAGRDHDQSIRGEG